MCVWAGTVLSNTQTLRSEIHSDGQQDLPIQDSTKEAVRRETLHGFQEEMTEQKNVNTDLENYISYTELYFLYLKNQIYKVLFLV